VGHVKILGGSLLNGGVLVLNGGVSSAWLVDGIFDHISGFKVSF